MVFFYFKPKCFWVPTPREGQSGMSARHFRLFSAILAMLEILGLHGTHSKGCNWDVVTIYAY